MKTPVIRDKRPFWFLLIFLFAFNLSANAQAHDCSLVLSSGDTLVDCRLISVHNDKLFVSQAGFISSVPVAEIVKIYRYRESKWLTGAIYGTLIGGTIGAILGVAGYEKPEKKPGDWFTLDFGPGFNAMLGGLFGAVVGCITGGIIGALYERDERYDLSRMTTEQKITAIRSIID